MEEHLDVVNHVVMPGDMRIPGMLRQPRQKIAESMQASYAALFEESRGSLSQSLRFNAASDVARLSGQPELAGFYSGRAEHAQDSTAGETVALKEAVLSHVHGVTLHPSQRRAEDLAALGAAGLSQYDIITLSQLIGFVAFQSRVVTGVQALCGHAAPTEPAPLPRLEIRPGFTADTIEWSSWLSPLDIESASAEQLAVLDESGPSARQSPYYLTLVHNAKVLQKRSETYNAVMYAPGGLSRVDREMSALVVSVVNGCHYCASVHAQRLNQLSRRTDLSATVMADPLAASLTPKERAVSEFAIRLTLAADAFGCNDLSALRDLGVSDAEILDLIHVVAIFGWANRLMLTLGQPANLHAIAPAATIEATAGGVNHG
ncbi:CMD domain-containing protein [Paraburkholderia sp.]|uniref:CMD domain-containing protein n=1 Tax=Paraburkholderia sp. TaxID=1926495 RepID=UPI0039E4FB6A